MAATPASAAVSGGEGAAAKALSLGEISGVHLGGPEPNVTEIGTPGGTSLAAEVAVLNKDESGESTSELESSSGSEGDHATEYGTPTVSTPTPVWPPYSSKTVNNDSLTWEIGESVIETPTRGCRRVTFGEETPASNYKAGGDGRVVGVVRETGVPQAPVYWGDMPAGRDRPYPDVEMGSSMQWPHGRDRPYNEVLMQYAPPLHGRDWPTEEDISDNRSTSGYSSTSENSNHEGVEAMLQKLCRENQRLQEQLGATVERQNKFESEMEIKLKNSYSYTERAALLERCLKSEAVNWQLQRQVVEMK